MTWVRSLPIVVLCVCGVVGLIFTAGSVAGGDNPTVVYPEDANATAGGSVEVDVDLSSDGGYGDIDVKSVTLVAEFDPEYVTVENVEPGSWLEQGPDTDIETTVDVDNEAGRVTVTQTRAPPAGGASGLDRYATIEFDVAADPPTETTEITYNDTDVILTDDFPVPVIVESNTLVSIEPERPGVGVLNLDRFGPGFTTGLALVAIATAVAVGLYVRRPR